MSRETLMHLLESKKPDIDGKELWIFGVGATTTLYRNGIERLGREGIKIFGYMDNYPEKCNYQFNGKKVYKPEELSEKKDEIYVLICTYYSNVVNAVSNQLSELGYSFCMIDNLILKMHSEEVLSVYDSFEDDESRDIYEKLINCRISGQVKNVPVDINEQYFALPGFVSNNPKEVFVDCGGYVGDTLERYIWKNEGVFGKIITFEPDLHNVKAMKYRIERLCNEWGLEKNKICVYEKGVSDSSKKASVNRSEVNNGFSSNFSVDLSEEGNDIISLDDFLTESFTFLKADIESWEYYMLIGAKQSIKQYKPKLAICIYHNALDFYQIPLLIKDILPEYKISIRHHSETLCETVLYAWI